jgi:acyl-homoserine-lactone acylase
MRLRRHTIVLLLVLLCSGCARLSGIIPRGSSGANALADAVTIARDEWGVPHIMAASDPAAAFGLGYAQAEDDFEQLEEDYLHALGRASHWYGERYLASDLLQRAFEVERLSREEYHREPADRRAIWDAFAAGINHYILTSGVRPRLITSFEAWMPFALARSIRPGTRIDGVQLGTTTRSAPGGTQLVGTLVDTTGSAPEVESGDEAQSGAFGPDVPSMWAIGPSRSESGSPLLLLHEAGPFSGSGMPYEMMLVSDDGWHVRGHAVRGMPVPAGGHNGLIAWGHTPSDADAADIYEVAFDSPADPLMYRHDGQWRRAVEWEDTLLVNSPAGVTRRTFRFRRTHHGPVVAEDRGAAFAVRIARMEEGGSLQQLYSESRASNLDEFRTALDQRALRSNTIYVDVEGSIYYLHGNAVPVRDTALDWSAPVDGSSSTSEWLGYHALTDLPQILNPASGWLHGVGQGLQASAPGDSPDPALFPRYMSTALESTGGRTTRRLLASDSSWTFEEWTAAAFDMRVSTAADAIARLVAEWEQVGGHNAARARVLDQALDALREWDYHADAASEPATLFVLWQEQLRTGRYIGEYALFRAMETVLARLEQDHGAAQVPLGVVNRLWRGQLPRTESAGVDDERGVAVGGAPAWAGSVFTFNATSITGSTTRYGVSGTRWIFAAELGPQPRSGSVVPFGQSGDSASAHWFDQAPLYAGRELKPGSFERAAALAAARRVYRPSDGTVRELP